MRATKTNLYIILSLAILFFSCNSLENKEKTFKESNLKKVSIVDTLSLQLNSNQKWIVNPETHKGITTMDSIISSFKTRGETDYKTLGKSLSKQTSYIIKNCNMKGEPHDQLHVVLIPMLDQISVLREEDNKKKLTLALQNLELLVEAYFKHFEL